MAWYMCMVRSPTRRKLPKPAAPKLPFTLSWPPLTANWPPKAFAALASTVPPLTSIRPVPAPATRPLSVCVPPASASVAPDATLKLPLLVADLLLLGLVGVLLLRGDGRPGGLELALGLVAVAVGAWLGCLAFLSSRRPE